MKNIGLERNKIISRQKCAGYIVTSGDVSLMFKQ